MNIQSQAQKNRYALLSVYDKTGIVEFAKSLQKAGFQIISTGGTAKILKENKIKVIPIQDITGNPESFDGRMKTISFQIESGILFDRSKKTHVKEAGELNIKPIDIVVCNLYPFEETISKHGVTLDEAVEQIDVGGPTMIRSAAKNFKHVIVVTDPNDYVEIGKQISKVSLEKRRKLSAKAFSHLSFYDSQIARYFYHSPSPSREEGPSFKRGGEGELFPQEITLPGRKIMDLRYGENPHQTGSVYLTPQNNSPFGNLQKHWGRDLSLTNLTDINAGLESVRLFKEPAAVIIKHNSPCGIALGKTIDQALERAIESDPESAFGGVVVLNGKLTMKAAKVIEKFKKDGRGNFDIIACESMDAQTLEFLKKVRKTVGIYTFGDIPSLRKDTMQIKWLDGGFILQTGDNNIESQFKDWKVVTKKKPTTKQLNQMKIAWKFISKIKSNSIIIVDKDIPMTRGIGSGQTSRIRSTKIAFEQAGKHASGAIMASDSFFPFDDSVKLAAEKGIGAIIQQGGSVNDQASIDAANKAGIPMVFTNYRAFWH